MRVDSMGLPALKTSDELAGGEWPAARKSVALDQLDSVADGTSFAQYVKNELTHAHGVAVDRAALFGRSNTARRLASGSLRDQIGPKTVHTIGHAPVTLLAGDQIEYTISVDGKNVGTRVLRNPGAPSYVRQAATSLGVCLQGSEDGHKWEDIECWAIPGALPRSTLEPTGTAARALAGWE